MGPEPTLDRPVEIAPFGAWRSSIRIEDVVGDVITLAEPWIDGDDVFWLEGRPAEAGRRVLVRAAADGSTTDLTPPPFNVRSRVHEYGGGSYVVAGGVVVFSDFADGRLYRLDPGSEVAVADHPGRRVAPRRPPARSESPPVHRRPRGSHSPRDADEHDRGHPARRWRVVRAGVRPGFRGVAARVAGRYPPGLARMGSPGHAVGCDATSGRRVRARRHARRVRAGGRRPGGIDRPARMGARRHAPPDQRPERLVEPVSPRRRPAARTARPDGGGVRGPVVDLRPIDLRLPARRGDRGRRPGRRAGSPVPPRAGPSHR